MDLGQHGVPRFMLGLKVGTGGAVSSDGMSESLARLDSAKEASMARTTQRL